MSFIKDQITFYHSVVAVEQGELVPVSLSKHGFSLAGYRLFEEFPK